MQTLTFTQKLLRQQSFFNFLIPLFAVFVGLGTSPTALGQTFESSNVTITAKTTSAAASTSQVYYGTLNGFGQVSFIGAALGGISGNNAVKFDPADGGVLTLDAASFRIKDTDPSVNSTIYRYRVYLDGTTEANKPDYSTIDLANQSNNIDFANSAANVNLLNQPSVLLGGGDFVVEILAQFKFDKPFNGPTTVSDPSAANGAVNGYMAFFSVASPLVTPSGGTTTWNGRNGTDWANAANWNNGVPTRTSNAVVPEPFQGVPAAYPILNNLGVYEVNDLTLVGQTQSSRGEVTVGQASLAVFGNLRQNAGGLRGNVTGALGVRNGTLNSTLILAGGNQVVTGRLSMPDVTIAGTGIKSITGTLLTNNTLSFQPTSVAGGGTGGVIVQSASEQVGATGPVFDTTLQTLIDLGETGIINQEAGYAETNTSYVKGVLRADRPISSAPQIFGNIGLDVTANYTSAVNVIIFRIIGDPLQSPSSTNSVPPVPIMRQYLVDNALDSGTPVFANATLSFVFHYLDSAYELNTIPEGNLTMFRSLASSPPYVPVFGTLNSVNNTVTRNGLPSLSRFVLTLGDRQNPLPVTLTSFNAKRMGADVLVTWETASEINSKGFEVQVSTDGEEFRTLGSVASASPNSAKKTSYRYVDTETNKVGTRYYRLRQIDIDGKDAFSAPRTVLFTGNALATAMVAYPNPIVGSELRLVLQSVAAGKGTLRITDITGRVIRQESVELTSGTSDLSVKALGDLKAGIYLVGVTLPTGETQNLKIMKQ